MRRVVPVAGCSSSRVRLNIGEIADVSAPCATRACSPGRADRIAARQRTRSHASTHPHRTHRSHRDRRCRDPAVGMRFGQRADPGQFFRFPEPVDYLATPAGRALRRRRLHRRRRLRARCRRDPRHRDRLRQARWPTSASRYGRLQDLPGASERLTTVRDRRHAPVRALLSLQSPVEHFTGDLVRVSRTCSCSAS